MNQTIKNHVYDFSIIIPVYNTPKELLTKCIQSVLAQSYDNFECIIIDDGSDKKCYEDIEEIAKTDSRIRTIHLRHVGNSHARNYGLSISSGEYITYVDSDDIITPLMLEDAYYYVKKYNPDMILGLVKSYNGGDFEYLQSYKAVEELFLYGRAQVGDLYEHIWGYRKNRLLFDEGYITSGPVARIIKKDVAEESFFPSEEYITEDVLWNANILSKTKSVIVISKIWYAYYKHPGSKSRKYYNDGPDAFNKQVEAYKEYNIKYWPDRKKGLYRMLWQEIAMYFRIYLNDKRISWFKRYKLYKDIFRKPEYIDMINNIDFSYERSWIKRITRKGLLLFIRLKIYFPTWFAWSRIGIKAL